MKHFFTLILFFSVYCCQAQQFYFRPKTLDNPLEDYKLTLKDIKNASKDRWNVFASKEGLTAKNSQGQSTSLAFMEKLQVIGHRSSGNSIQLNLRSNIRNKEYGWINANDLLLTEFGRVDSKTGFRLKYLPVTKIGDIDTRQLNDEGYSVNFYNGPSERSSVNFTVKAFSGFWYLFKKQGDWCLLGRASKLNNGPVIDKQLIGWIKEDRLLEWDQRLVLQPNQDRLAFDERLRESLVITAFYDSLEAIQYMQNPNNTINLNNNVFSEELQKSYNKDELSAKTIRWPILRNNSSITGNLNSDREGAFRVGVKGRPTTGSNRQIFNQLELDALNELLKKSEDSFNEINVVFVIDATYSMGNYIKSVRNAMLELIEILQNDKRANYSFGAVLYTDASEGQVGLRTSGEIMMDFNGIANWLENKEEYFTDKNKSLTEGVFDGLLQGVKFFHNVKETNFIIHVGDAAGNDVEKKQKLIRELLNYDVSLISIQAHNPLSRRSNRPLKSYQDFHLQMKDLVLEVVKKQDESLQNETPVVVYNSFFASQTSRNKLEYINDVELSNAEYSTYQTALNRYPVQSLIQVSHPGYSVPWPKMALFIRNIMLSIEQNNNQLLNELYTSKGEGLGEKTFRASIVDRLIKAGFNQDDISLWLRRAYEALLEVYVPRRVEGAKYPLLEFALFIDQEELKELRSNLQRLTDSNEGISALKDPDNPKGLFRTIKRILKLYVDETDDDDFAQIQIATALRLMIGLNEDYDSGLNRYLDLNENSTLERIRYLDDKQVVILIDSIEKIWEQLSPTLWESNAFISYGGQKYYWIPQRALVIEKI